MTNATLAPVLPAPNDEAVREYRRRAKVINALVRKAPLTKPQIVARGVPLATIYALANEGVIVTIGPNDKAQLMWVLREQAPAYTPTWR